MSPRAVPHDPEEIIPIKGSLWMTKEDWKRSWAPWLRGTAFGFPIGALPAGGAEVPTFLSYSTERRLCKYPEEFGKGAIEGVAGPEAANNASAAGTLVPLLTLGLPTSATAAIMLAGFQQYGLNPGPLLFAEKPDLVWGLIASLFIANVMLVIINLPLIGIWVRLLAIPQPWLYAGILVFATMGTLAVNASPVELGMLFVFGYLGYLMRRYDYPVAPMVVGLDPGADGGGAAAARAADQPGRPDDPARKPDLGDAAGPGLGRAGRALRHEGPEQVQGGGGLSRTGRHCKRRSNEAIRGGVELHEPWIGSPPLAMTQRRLNKYGVNVLR
jgi:hypothetical protein